MKNLNTILEEPLTMKEIEDYYMKTKNKTLKVLLSVSLDDFFELRPKFIAKLSEKIVGSNYFVGFITFTIKNGNVDGLVILDVTCDLEQIIQKIELEQQKKIEEEKLEREITEFHEKMLEYFNTVGIPNTIKEYIVKIDVIENKKDFTYDVFNKKIERLIEKNEVSFDQFDIDGIFLVDKPLWLSFENIAHNIDNDPMQKPESMTNIVELIGRDDYNKFYFKVHEESKINSHEWYDIIKQGDNYLDKLGQNVLPSLKKDSFDVDVITNFLIRAKSAAIILKDNQEDYYLSSYKKEKKIKSLQKNKIFKVSFCDAEVYKKYQDSFLKNLEEVILSSDDTCLVNIPKSSQTFTLLGFSSKKEPIFIGKELENYTIKNIFIGSINEYNEEFKNRLVSLMPSEAFDITDIITLRDII